MTKWKRYVLHVHCQPHPLERDTERENASCVIMTCTSTDLSESGPRRRRRKSSLHCFSPSPSHWQGRYSHSMSFLWGGEDRSSCMRMYGVQMWCWSGTDPAPLGQLYYGSCLDPAHLVTWAGCNLCPWLCFWFCSVVIRSGAAQLPTASQRGQPQRRVR